MTNNLSLIISALENLPIGCVVVDSEINIIYSNNCMFSYFNISDIDYKGKRFGNVFNCAVVANGEGNCGTLAECSLCELRNGIECVIRKEVGALEAELNHIFQINDEFQTKWFGARANIIQADEKEYIIVNLLDITSSKKLETLLKKNDEKYRMLFENMTQGFSLHEIITDKDGKPIDYRFIDVNPTFEILTGLKHKDIVGKTVMEVLPDTEPYWIEIFGKVAISGEPNHFENYSSAIGKYYDTWAFCPEVGMFAVIFSDITEKKNYENKLYYYYYHDSLTALFNRRYIINQLPKIDIIDNLPLSVIVGDINGLKLANDAFGRKFGDNLIKKMSNIITNACSNSDIIAKWGGDEVIILLPKSDEKRAEKIISTIKAACKNRKTAESNLSISFGYATKNAMDIEFEEALNMAEDMMLRNKACESAGFRGQTINIILNTLHAKNKREEQHSRRVSEICVKIGMAMGFSESELNKLRVIGLLHDIGKIGIDEEILNKKDRLTDKEFNEIKKHSEIGYRILSSTNETSELAQHVLYHHERLDGKGYPNGIGDEEISVITRILSIADAYDAMTSNRPYRVALNKEEVINEMIKNSGTQFDSNIVDIFIKNILEPSCF
jgi:diguanylate cyclase (GGDEF)-like protein/putative nucleotidyltransferase with HDIG domain/PAS domain S-box-containing protein